MKMADGKKELKEWIKAICAAGVIVYLIRWLMLTPIVVDGSSMVPTLQNEDHILVNKLSYTFTRPERFDIIVFQAEQGRDYIKRVIGLPGDEVVYKNDTLYINGRRYEEPYLDTLKKQLTDGLPLTEPFSLEDKTDRRTVPEDCLFVLGDNRRYSKDSRHIGFISSKQILGNGKIVFWPTADIRLVK